MDQQQINPYQAPESSTVPDKPRGVYLEGEFLVVANGTVMPPICLKTGAPLLPSDPIRAVLRWPKFMWILGLPFGPIGWVISAFALYTQRKARLDYYLSTEAVRHRSRWTLYSAGFLIVAVILIALIVYLEAYADISLNPMISLPPVCFVLALSWVSLGRGRAFRVSKIEEDWIWLGGLSLAVRKELVRNAGQATQKNG